MKDADGKVCIKDLHNCIYGCGKTACNSYHPVLLSSQILSTRQAVKVWLLLRWDLVFVLSTKSTTLPKMRKQRQIVTYQRCPSGLWAFTILGQTSASSLIKSSMLSELLFASSFEQPYSDIQRCTEHMCCPLWLESSLCVLCTSDFWVLNLGFSELAVQEYMYFLLFFTLDWSLKFPRSVMMS